MSKLKIELEGDDVIDNASIYLEDPLESIEYKLQPKNDTDWNTTVSVSVEGPVDYSLHVVAFTGTHFKCTITNLDTDKKIDFDGITGTIIKNRANIKGSKNFE